MKQIVLFLGVLLVLSFGASAQTIVFSEDFEGGTYDVTSSSTGGTNWGVTNTASHAGTYSDSAKSVAGDTLFLTTNTFSTVNNFFVILEFAHVAKVSVIDGAFIQYSADDGTTWTTVTTADYLGSGIMQNDNFKVISYPAKWDPAGTGSIHDSMFVVESFNLSSLIGNTATAKIRFGLAGGAAPNGYIGWFIDDITITMSPSELIPPTIAMVPPVVKDTLTQTVPYTITAHVSDASGIDTAYISYTATGGIADTVGMTMITQDTFAGAIPFQGFGRDIYYQVNAIDSSNAANETTFPAAPGYHIYSKYSPGMGSVVWTEDFESGISAWTQATNDGYDWSHHTGTTISSNTGPNGAYEGTYYMYFETSISHPGNAVIESPTIDLSAVNKPLLNFYYHMYGATMGTLRIDVYHNGAWVNNVFSISGQQHTSHADPWKDTLIDISAYKSSSFKFRFSGTTTTSYTSDFCIDFIEIGEAIQLGTDIGIDGFTNPTGGVVAGQNFDVDVNFRNFGLDTITSADIDWTLDGVAQTAYAFTGSLKQDSTANITLGTVSVTAGPHTVKAWTSNPNGSSDLDLSNDTSYFDFYGCANLLSGTYTIGGTSPDFTTFADAALALNQCGISGPVTFNVASGTYNEQFALNFVNGSSPVNTITFKSAAGDSSLVTLAYDASGNSDNYVVKLDGTSYIAFEDMSFVAEDSSYANVFVVGNDLDSFMLSSCVVSTLIKPTDANNDMDLISTEGAIGDYVMIQNSAFYNGTNAITLSGTGSYSGNWVIQNNIIKGHYAGGIALSNSDSPVIEMNEIEADTSSIHDSYNGIAVTSSMGSATIEMNTISTKNTQIAYGIVLSGSEFDSLNPSSVINNMITLRGFSSSSTLSAGILINEAKNVNVFYNTAHLFGNQTNAVSLCLYDAANPAVETRNIEIVNNNFTNRAMGYVYYITGVDTADFHNDFNNLYEWGTGTQLVYLNGTNIADLATWQLESSAANITYIDPYYQSDADLHVYNNVLNNTGTPLTGITTDFEGDARDASTPDVGADEFDATPFDAYAIAITGPMGYCGMSSTETITLQFKNVGSSDITGNLTAKYQIVGSGTTFSEAVPQTIPSGDTLIYAFSTTADFDVSALGMDSTYQIVAWLELTNDPVQLNDTVFFNVTSMYQPPAPITATATCTYGQSVDLTAITNDSLYWYASMSDTVELYNGSIFNTGILYDTTTFYVGAKAGGGILAITEVTQYQGFGQGNTNPLPSYIVGDDFVELSNVGSGPMDITGYTYHREGTSAFTYSLPSITLQAGEVMILATYGGSTDDPANKYYVAANASTSSGNATGHYITDPSGAVVDAVALNGHSFSSSSPVTAADWSGAIGSSSSRAGVSRLLYDNNLPSDWYISDASNPQTLGTFNPQLPVTGGSGCESARVPLQVNVVGFPTEDAGVVAILNPPAAVPAGTSQIVTAEIYNYGINPLTTVDVVWALNGVAQDTFHYSGSIPYQGVDTVNLDTTVFNGGVYTIVAWTDAPNGVSDTINTNDTLQYSFNACLNGTYTIGDTAGGVYFDFPSFSDAVFALNNAGVCGHVVFNVDAGTYTETLDIFEIQGAGPSSTITFQSVTGDSTDVILEHNASGSGDNWCVRLNGADYITFQNMHFRALNNSYGTCIDLTGGANHNAFLNNFIESIGTSGNNYGIKNGNTLNHYNTFSNNRIENGYYGIYVQGSGTSSWEKGTVIENNDIRGFYYTGIYAQYQDSIQILNNKIHENNTSYGYYGIYAYYLFNEFNVSNNMIDLDPSGYGYGLRVYYCNYFSYITNPGVGLVSNNMVHVHDGTNVYGLYAYYSNNVKYYHNTVKVATGNNGYALYQSNTSSNNLGETFYNNVFYDSVGTYAAYFGTPINVTADYNSYFSTGSDLAYWTSAHTSLASLQAISPADNQNSLVVDPLFASASDLHLLSTDLSGYALPVAEVPTDIDGDVRSLVSPTIGADEVPLLPYDLGVRDIFGVPDSTFEGYTYAAEVEVKNFGTSTIYNYSIEYTINNGTPVSVAISDSIVPGQIDTLSIGTITSPAGLSTICAKTIHASDTNAFNDSNCHDFFGVPTKDAYVTAVLGIDGYCGMTTDTIFMWVKNIGIDTINSSTQTTPTTVSFVTDIGTGQTPTTETFTDVLAPGDSVLFTFSGQADFTNTSQYDSIFTVAAWIDYVGDNVSYNDTAYTDVNSFHIPYDPVFTSPVSLNFGSPVTLSVSSVDSVFWFETDTSSTEFHIGSSYTTPFMYLTDTFWVQAMTSSSAPLKITELNLGSPDYVEVQNVGSTTFDATGYKVIISDDYTNINDVNSITWNLGVFQGGEVQWRDDVSSSGANYWGNNIFWSSSASNGQWAVIVDPNNEVVDAVFINYTEADIHGSAIPNGSQTLDMTSSWTGDGVPGTTDYIYRLTYDSDDASDFVNQSSGDKGIMNVGLTGTASGGGCSSNRLPFIVNVSAQPASDVGLLSQDAPVSGVYLDQEVISVTVKNFGSADQYNFPITYILDDTITVTETIDTIVSGASIIHNFTTLGDFSIQGNTYHLRVYTGLTTDVNGLNDTTDTQITNVIPNYCASSALYDSYSEIGSFSFGGKTNVSPPPYTANYTDYTSLAPGTISVGNDFDIDVEVVANTTLFSGGFIEVYIDFNKDGVLTEPDEIAFAAPYTTSAGVYSGVVSVPSNAQPGNTFMRVVVEHWGTAAGTLPCGTYSYGETEDYMINILPKIPQDAGVKQIITPSIVALNASEPLSVQVNNFGALPIVSVDVVYELNNNAPVTTTYTTGIDTSTFAVVDLGNINLNYGNNSLCVYTVLAGDTNYFNDESCLTIFREATEVAPYFEDFETNNLWFNDTLNTQWEYGEPTTSTITGAYSGTKAWATKLDTFYVPQVFPGGDFLYTPKIVTIGLDSAYVSFWHTMNVDASDDFGVLQVSVNNGNYTTIGTMTDTLGTNWYNDDIGGAHGWSYANQAWQESKYHIDFLDQFGDFYQADTLQFRFAFYSDGTTSGDGWAIDDFDLGLYKAPVDAGVISIDAPTGSTALGDSTQVTVTIENKGLNALSNFDVSYTVNGTVMATEQYTGTLATATTASFTFATKFVAPIDDYEVCAYTSVIGDAYPTNDGDCEPITADPAHYDASATIVWPTSIDTTSLSYKPHVYIQIENHGTQTLTSIPVEYTISGNVVQDTWSGTLPQGGTAQFTFTDQYQSPLGNYELCVRTVVPNDGNPANDEDCDFLYGVVTSVDNLADNDFILNQNQPNPVKDDYVITYELPNSGDVHFELHNSLGQLIMVLEEDGHAGSNTIKLNASQLNAGVYYYSVEYNGMRKTLQMVVTK